MRKKSVTKFLKEFAEYLDSGQMTWTQMFEGLIAVDKECLTPIVHEAGHAIVAWELDFPILEMNLDEFNYDEEGNYHKYLSYLFDVEEILTYPKETQTRLSLVSLGGIAAERIALPKSFENPLNTEYWDSDLERVADYIHCLKEPDEDFNEVFLSLFNDAREILEDHWDRLEALVVGAFRLGPILNGRQILHLIEGTDTCRKRSRIKRPAAERCKSTYSNFAGAPA